MRVFAAPASRIYDAADGCARADADSQAERICGNARKSFCADFLNVAAANFD